MGVTEQDFRNMQGLIRFGYRKLTEASFLLLGIRDAEAARTWLRSAPVTDAVERTSAPDTALQIAFTAQGLQRLGLSDAVLQQFSLEFLGGMSEDSGRSRMLGDVGTNAPQHWDWGKPGQAPDVVVLLYARPGHLHEWSQQVQNAVWHEAFDVIRCLPTSDQEEYEPFGFRDSLSQPTIDWRGVRRVEDEQLTYSNLVSAGEFLLGHTNEYGRYTDRPLLSSEDASVPGLPHAADVPAKLDLGREGCFLVLRTLEQDVAGFWNFAHKVAGDGAELFAAAMVGRTREGVPLVALSDEPIPGVDPEDTSLNQFTFDQDGAGLRCPFGAHVRRANPRNADLPTPPAHGLEKALRFIGLGQGTLHSDTKASTRFHRILRRGREYGPGAGQDGANPPSPNEPRGIQFICLVANIARQFEFLQGAWMNSSKFDAMSDESDPLLGNREPVAGASTDAFSQPQASGLRERATGVPQFVTVKGGAYFFLPSIAFLRYLAGQ